MIHPHTELAWINSSVGNGVLVTQRIPKGTVVWVQCPLDIVLKPEQVTALPAASREIVEIYSYIDADGDSILCWDLGRYVNHSCNPAMLAVNRYVEIAVRDIEVGEELTCDYGILNYTKDLVCGCGSPSCRKRIKATDALDSDAEVVTRVEAALQLAGAVAQPLKAYLPDTAGLDGCFDGTATVSPPSAYFHRRG